jgi:hypothetical protein
MSQESSGANSNGNAGGGAQGGNTNTIESVSKADHQRVLDDMMKFKKNFNDTAKENEDLKARLEALEKAGKESSGDFKSLAEQYKNTADEWKGKYDGLKGSIVINEKHKAASQALLKAGMKADALKILEKEDFKDIEVEATTSGRFLVHGVDLFVDKFKKEYPFAFGTGEAPVVNTGGGGSSNDHGDELTPKRLHEIEIECRKKNDMNPYYEAVKKYSAQKAKKLN